MPTPRYPLEAPAPGGDFRAHGAQQRTLGRVEADVAALEERRLASASAPAFASNDSTIPTNPASDAIYDVPATSAASTITLPATARERTRLTFFADGVKNAHTVQYRDATGPTNLTAALTASKRHVVVAVFLGGKWGAVAGVSP